MHAHTTPSTTLHRARALIVCVALLVLSPACAQKVYIKTEPSQAQASLDDGRVLGETPMILKSDTWAWTAHRVTLSKEGYRPEVIELDAGPSLTNIALCAIGICALWMAWPVCVAGNYKQSDYAVKLKPDPTADLSSTRATQRARPLEPTQKISFTPRTR